MKITLKKILTAPVKAIKAVHKHLFRYRDSGTGQFMTKKDYEKRSKRTTTREEI